MLVVISFSTFVTHMEFCYRGLWKLLMDYLFYFLLWLASEGVGIFTVERTDWEGKGIWAIQDAGVIVRPCQGVAFLSFTIFNT